MPFGISRTRSFVWRVSKIDQAIRSGTFPSAHSLAKDIEVSLRTIYRDVDYMKNLLGSPIVVSRHRKGYYYREKNYRLPAITLTQAELVSIFIAEKALHQYHGTPYEKALSDAFNKITQLLPEEISVDLSSLDEALSFQTSAATVQDIETFCQLASAVLSRKQLRITYHTQYRDETSDRVVDPYHLANIDGDWYLVAFCHMRQEIRMFSPSRVQHIEETGETFIRPDGFSLGEYLGSTFKVMKGTGHHHIELLFSKDQARYVKERIWHKTQTLEPMPDGRLKLCLDVSSLDEIKRWVLSYGEDCEVVGPEELKKTVRGTVRKMYERCGDARHPQPDPPESNAGYLEET